ncbi:hypothetical protein FE257_005876 [Aspergillus nanangensis]|uniref:Sensor histidine kinase/response regulator n=1 Tax=Aspergillus nanangensis TaxID=2582783 RepID=A0AAD4GV72_ASPNN|nr:hypothetical protein FE257_005876 [Aspergillus nanangensis]
MVLLEPTVPSRPHLLPDGQQMVPELLRLYRPAFEGSSNGVHSHISRSTDQGRQPSNISLAVTDPCLPALTQLGVFRLTGVQAFTTLLDGAKPNVIAQATTQPLTHNDHTDDHLGTRTIGLNCNPSETIDSANITSNPCQLVIRDLEQENDLRAHPFIVRHPHIRFYVEVPLRTTMGEVLGTYCLVDEKPRPVFAQSDMEAIQEVAHAISAHLENVWSRKRKAKSHRMLGGLLKFIQDEPEIAKTERNARTASNVTSPPSAGFPEMDALSLTTSNISRDLSPTSTRPPRETSRPRHEVFNPSHESREIGPKPHERHQEHVRRCSDESSTLVTVAERSSPSPGTSLLFSTASSLIMECMELDGVVFLDPSMSNSRRHSNASSSDWEQIGRDADSVASSSHPPSHGQWSDKACEPLGLCLSDSSAENNNSGFRLSLTEGILHDMFTAFPNGEIFHLDHPLPFPIPLSGGRRHSLQSLESKQHLHHVVTSHLANEFPDAKSAIFLPLWNWDKSRWLTGTLIWTCDARPPLVMDDLAYLKTFGDSLTAEFSQLRWAATEQSKTDLLSSVSHELRSPLHGMLAGAELLQTTSLDTDQRDMVTMVETCGLTLLDTMNYLLDYAKINNLTHIHKTGGSNDNVDLENLMTAFDLDTLVEQVTEAFSAVSGKATGSNAKSSDDLSVVVRVEEQNSWAIHSISGAWRRIVMNLLGNAFKFTQSGLIEVSLSKIVEREGYSKSVYAHLSITDTGCGISPDFLEHNLFRPFAQENMLTEGVGLGLSIVQQLVTNLGGSIEVKSQLGGGTQVEVRIPVAFAAETPLDAQPLRRPEQPGARTVTRVCLIGLNAYADLKDAPCGVLSTEAKRKLSIRGAVSNVLLSQPGWMVSFADSIENSSGDIAVIEESSLKRISAKGPIKAQYHTIMVLGENGVSLPDTFAIEGADVIYLAQPIGPRKITDALQRYIDSHHEASPSVESPISGPFSGIPQRGRSLSDAFALAKGIESPPVMKENVAEFAPATLQAVDHKKLHVLIVDDNDINIKILTTFMRRIRCSYETATNGQIALDKYKERDGKFDYVLMDISMPVMDGIVSSSKIREYEEQHKLPRATIMAVTGVASSSMQQQAFAAGIDDYLVKPLSLHDLKRIMNIT